MSGPIRPQLGHIVLPCFDVKQRMWRLEQRRGRVFRVNGRMLEMFPIGVLAATLGHTARAVALWEQNGRFPKPMWHMPNPNNANSLRRWYSKTQIANLRALYKSIYLNSTSQYVRRDFFEEVWRIFFQPDLTPLAQKGDVQ